MSRGTLGLVVLVIGVIVVVVSALADPIGIGSEEGFGWKQTVGVVVGVVIALVGAIVVLRTDKPKPGGAVEA